MGSVCISLQAPIRALTLAFSRRHRFLSGRIGTIIAGSGFCCDTRGDAICLGFTHLVDPWLTDEHIHDLCAVDPAPPGKVVRLAHRVAHAMGSNSVVLDVAPHTDPTRQIMIQVESGFDHLPLHNVRIFPMPTLIIDADACPVTREALACARSARIPVLIAGNSTQNLARRIRRDDPRDAEQDRKSTRLNSSHEIPSRMPSSA